MFSQKIKVINSFYNILMTLPQYSQKLNVISLLSSSIRLHLTHQGFSNSETKAILRDLVSAVIHPHETTNLKNFNIQTSFQKLFQQDKKEVFRTLNEIISKLDVTLTTLKNFDHEPEKVIGSESEEEQVKKDKEEKVNEEKVQEVRNEVKMQEKGTECECDSDLSGLKERRLKEFLIFNDYQRMRQQREKEMQLIMEYMRMKKENQENRIHQLEKRQPKRKGHLTQKKNQQFIDHL